MIFSEFYPVWYGESENERRFDSGRQGKVTISPLSCHHAQRHEAGRQQRPAANGHLSDDLASHYNPSK
jgi:hypothetical protein